MDEKLHSNCSFGRQCSPAKEGWGERGRLRGEGCLLSGLEATESQEANDVWVTLPS